jgi:glycogen debranching enzyme
VNTSTLPEPQDPERGKATALHADPAPSSHAVDAAPAAQYAIAVTDTLQQRRTRTLKHGDTFAVIDQRGDIGGEPGNPEGIYHRDTRMLSQFQLLLEEAPPLLLSSMTQDDNAVFTADLSNPDLLVDGRIAVRRENIHLNRMMFIWNGARYERLLVRNFSDRLLQLRLTYRFASDFADLFEVRGEHRKARGEAHAALESDHGVKLAYRGLDQVERTTYLSFCPAPKTLTTARAVYELALKPRSTRRIFVRCGVATRSYGEWNGRLYYRRMRDARHALRESSERAASVAGSNSVFNEVMRRSVSDLYMLITDTPQGPYPYAGIPWFSTPFGRDALITALMTLWMDPAIAKGVLHFLAHTQATSVEPVRDAEPGKILHEMRHGEMANLREVPFGRYYGSIDSTPLFVLLLGEYFRRSGDLETVRTLWPNALAALEWIDRYGDRDGDGFVEYFRQTKEGLANQGWKDSYDAVFHQDGRTAEGPIALCEVQAYVYGAKRHAATMAEALGETERAAALAAAAETLRERFEERFWCEELSVYALALDGEKTPCRVVSSNAGQVLFTGIASPERAERVARTLLSSPVFSGWGIRTVSSSAARYNPMSYHNGSVWPHDNALIAMGFARYGQKDAAARVFGALFGAASYMDLRRLPELFCGFVRLERNEPCLLQASLGLELLDRTGEVKFYRPRLPDFLEHVHLRNLQLSTGSVDVLLHRHDHNIAVTVTRREGDVVVVVRY